MTTDTPIQNAPADPEEIARTVAAICGPHSGAALAIGALDRLRGLGERAWITLEGQNWIVHQAGSR